MTENKINKSKNLISSSASLVEIAEKFAENGEGDLASNTINLHRRFWNGEFEFDDLRLLGPQKATSTIIRFGDQDLCFRGGDFMAYFEIIKKAIELICKKICSGYDITPDYNEAFDSFFELQVRKVANIINYLYSTSDHKYKLALSNLLAPTPDNAWETKTLEDLIVKRLEGKKDIQSLEAFLGKLDSKLKKEVPDSELGYPPKIYKSQKGQNLDFDEIGSEHARYLLDKLKSAKSTFFPKEQADIARGVITTFKDKIPEDFQEKEQLLDAINGAIEVFRDCTEEKLRQHLEVDAKTPAEDLIELYLNKTFDRWIEVLSENEDLGYPLEIYKNKKKAYFDCVFNREKDRFKASVSARIIVNRGNFFHWIRLGRNNIPSDWHYKNDRYVPFDPLPYSVPFWGDPWENMPEVWDPKVDDAAGLSLKQAWKYYSDSHLWAEYSTALANRDNCPEKFENARDKLCTAWIKNFERGSLEMSGCVFDKSNKKIIIKTSQIQAALSSNKFDFENNELVGRGIIDIKVRKNQRSGFYKWFKAYLSTSDVLIKKKEAVEEYNKTAETKDRITINSREFERTWKELVPKDRKFRNRPKA